MSSGSFKNHVTYKLFAYKSYIYICNKHDLALNNPQELIYNKTQSNQTKDFLYA